MTPSTQNTPPQPSARHFARSKPALVLGAAIVAVWLVMLGVLVKRVYFPQVSGLISLPKVEDLAGIMGGDRWMSIYYKGRKIGFSSSSLVQEGSGFHLREKTFMRLNIMDQIQEIRTLTGCRVTPDFKLISFDFHLMSGLVNFYLSGEVSPDQISLKTRTGGRESQTVLPIKEPPYMPLALGPYLAMGNPAPGTTLQLPLFDPATMAYKTTTIKVLPRENVPIGGMTYRAIPVVMDFMGIKVKSWIDETGRTLKEEGLLGFKLVLSTDTEATADIAGSGGPDLLAAAAVPVKNSIKNPRETTYVKIKLGGIKLSDYNLNDQRQKLTGDELEIRKEEIYWSKTPIRTYSGKEMEADLAPNLLIQSDAPEIIEQSRKILGDEHMAQAAARKLNIWVFQNLKKHPTLSVPNALETLQTKAGDCNEHAALLTALLRAAGIPARVAVGLGYFRDKFYYHAWCDAYVGRWISMDATLGQFPADATHISFARGGLEQQVVVGGLIGRLEAEVLESK
ncbi:MAG: transglutaminase domain-containing protein [Deltaproteobacteria bacterium]|nr:transglutaminase domain-containing protein [Deltaproteobacteria bacterium]